MKTHTARDPSLDVLSEEGRSTEGCDRPITQDNAESGVGPVPVASVYVHAPFCARRCRYCDFAVTVRSKGGRSTEWATAIARELTAVRREGVFELADTLQTLYVGGGTPSLLAPEAMGMLAGILGRRRLQRSLEWTVEANPESFGPELARGWKEAGVNRISLGVQSFNDTALKWMGRLHGALGASEAVSVARKYGFRNLGADLIFGLPSHLSRNWTDDLHQALALEIEHISLYGLTVEPGTKLGREVAGGSEHVAGASRYREEYLEAAELLRSEGFLHYEVSNFAREGFEGKHNKAYWSGLPYLGLGNGAHSYAPPLRRWNQRDWQEYSTRLERGASAEDGRERLTFEQQLLERIWLGLRSSQGLEVSVLQATGSPSARSPLVDRWIRNGLARLSEDRLQLTVQGWLLLDTLTVELSEAVAAARGNRAQGPEFLH